MKKCSDQHQKRYLIDIRGGGTSRELGLRALIKCYEGLLYKLQGKHRLSDVEAREAYAECFEAVWNSTEYGKIENEKALPGYIYTTLNRKCLDQIRKRKTTKMEDIMDHPDLKSRSPNPEEQMGHQDLKRGIESWLHKLNEKCRDLLTKIHLVGYKPRELAKELNCQASEISDRKYKCMIKLRKIAKSGGGLRYE